MNMLDVYTFDDLSNWDQVAGGLEPPARLAVLGDPVAHSLSPQLHDPALAAAGIAARYVRIHVTSEQFPSALRRIAELGFIGVNVTVPHKFAALHEVDQADDLARRLGAVNTIVFEDGRLLGFNTDGPGFVRAIREDFSMDVRDMRVLILGAGGGAGRAVAVQCAVEGCEGLVLVNRTLEKILPLAEELAPSFHDSRVAGPTKRLEAIPWDTVHLRSRLDHIDLIVNATSIGMKHADPELVPASMLQPHHLVYDMVYSPARTRLISAAESAGARAANGVSMLIHQGALAFEHWFNRPAPISAMRSGVRTALGLS